MLTSRRLRKYIGPQDYVNWPDKSKRENMEKNIQVIQDKADQIYEKFKSFFAFQVRLQNFSTFHHFYCFICVPGRRQDVLGGI